MSKSSAVRLDETDLSLYKKLESIEPGVRICMACGSCTSTCTAGPWSGMSVRKVILELQRIPAKRLDLRRETPPGPIKLGKRVPEESLSEGQIAKMLSACMLCGKCTMVCPRGINTRHLILSLCRIYKEKL